MMREIKVILVAIGVVLTSLYLFPFELLALPGINTKMVMAVIGLALFVGEATLNRGVDVHYKYVVLGALAILVSLFSHAAMTVNNTLDDAYLGYIVTLCVWLGAAYCAAWWIKYTHGKVSVVLVSNYLIAVCVLQCVLALLIDVIPAFKFFVNSYIGNFGGMGPAAGIDSYDRLYGIGAALDIAGSRFAAVLVIIAAMLRYNSKYLWFYLFSFLIILVLGNMIARTTTVGVFVAIMFLVITRGDIVYTEVINRVFKHVKVIAVIAVLVAILAYFYNSDVNFRENLRFGFEGFFSLFETGSWQSDSNDILKSMYRFPETTKTWLIGDGYMSNPMSDPYYMGYHWKGFYMGTDVGYLRFIYYFGVFGLFAIVSVMLYAAMLCASKFPVYKRMFFCLLIVNLIVWFKVSTDLLVIFAVFLCVRQQENDAYEKEYEDSIPDSLDV